MGQAHAVATVDADAAQVRLLANANGSLSAIQLNGGDIDNFDLLRQRVAAIILTKPDLEVELFPDEHLHYEHFIQAITAVSGEFHDGQIRKICSRITFVRQKQEDQE